MSIFKHKKQQIHQERITISGFKSLINYLSPILYLTVLQACISATVSTMEDLNCQN